MKSALVLASAALAGAVVAGAQSGPAQHVLLLSVDGMHAVDLQNCASGVKGVNGGAPYCPNLAALAATGVNYTAAATSKPSDSFPGLMTLVTGATPKTMGVYYDVAYDRSLDAPTKTTGNGVAAGPCTAGAAPTGTTTEYEEGIDRDQTKLNGGAPGAGLTEGGIASIDPQRLPRDPAAGCAPVYPWQFVRTNSVYGVIKRAGGYTAWADKHPSYSSIGGPGGQFVDDYFSPEINSNVVALPGIKTPEGASCAQVRDANSDLTSWTNSFENIQCYDQIKVDAILNQIAGKTHGGAPARVPNIFGMNFQAVSVGQKLIEGSTAGGYTDARGIPSAALLGEIEYVDAAVGRMVAALKQTGNYQNTLVVITAKHGQSPIDPALYKRNGTTTPATLIASELPDSESPANASGIGPVEDDISLLWLKPGASTMDAVATIEKNATEVGLGEIFYGPTLSLNYNMPGLGKGLDPRTPDIIVTPNVGVTYSNSKKKGEEHGGFLHDDTNAVLLVANPRLKPGTVSAPVATAQVAPTILLGLGLDPSLLDAVKEEGTAVLPGLSVK